MPLTSCVNTAIKSVKSDMLSTKSDRVTLVLCQVFPASSSGGGVKEVELGSTVVRSCDLVMPEYLVELSTVREGSCGGGVMMGEGLSERVGHVGEGWSGSGERVWRGGVGGWGEVEWEGSTVCSEYGAAYLVGEEIET